MKYLKVISFILVIGGGLLMNYHCLGLPYGISMLAHTKWFDWAIWGAGNVTYLVYVIIKEVRKMKNESCN